MKRKHKDETAKRTGKMGELTEYNLTKNDTAATKALIGSAYESRGDSPTRRGVGILRASCARAVRFI